MGGVVHEVRPGQSLWAIADAYGSTVADLAAINGLSAENPILYVGQKLHIRMVKAGIGWHSHTNLCIPPLLNTKRLRPH